MAEDKEFKPPQRVSFIKHFNDPNVAETFEGHKVQREEKIYLPEWGKYVMCMPYDTHFLYLDPITDIPGRWFAWCTCGGWAVIISAEDASKMVTYQDPYAMLACYVHLLTGKHQDGTG